jgi:hypothetical protein
LAKWTVVRALMLPVARPAALSLQVTKTEIAPRLVSFACRVDARRTGGVLSATAVEAAGVGAGAGARGGQATWVLASPGHWSWVSSP